MASPDDGEGGDEYQRRQPPSAAKRLNQLAGRAGALGGGVLESGSLEGPPYMLGAGRISTSLEQLETILRYDVVENPDTALGQEQADAFLGTAKSALNRLATEGAAAELSLHEDIGLEAVIEVDGSLPSIPFKDGVIDPANPRLGKWAEDLSKSALAIKRAARATGRILMDGDTSDHSVKGTAFMIAPGLAATAKHVVQGIAANLGSGWFLKFGHEFTIDFFMEHNRPFQPEKRIKIRGIHWASAAEIAGKINLANLDMAILELEEEGPKPLTGTADLGQLKRPPRIHVIGHPRRLVEADLALHPSFKEIKDIVFGQGFGVKRWSPGIIQIGPGVLPEDQETSHVLTHNASTLGGNSGSPLFDLTAIPDRLVGLHYGGWFGDENYAHCSAPFAAPLIEAGATFL